MRTTNSRVLPVAVIATIGVTAFSCCWYFRRYFFGEREQKGQEEAPKTKENEKSEASSDLGRDEQFSGLELLYQVMQLEDKIGVPKACMSQSSSEVTSPALSTPNGKFRDAEGELGGVDDFEVVASRVLRDLENADINQQRKAGDNELAAGVVQGGKEFVPLNAQEAAQFRRNVCPQLNGKTVGEVHAAGDEEQRSKALIVPGCQLIYFKTFGCSHNMSDSESMKGLLHSYGYSFVQNLNSADLVVINSCTVKNPSQEGMATLIREAKALNLPVVVAGCVPQADRTLDDLKDVSVVGVAQIDRIVEVVEEALHGHVVKLLAKRKKLGSLQLPKVRKNDFVEIIPISNGCLGACTYCKTKQARGRLQSYPPEEILERVRSVLEEPSSLILEIWLTSEDSGAYGLDLPPGTTNIADLMASIATFLEEFKKRTGRHVMLRLGMTNPPYMAKYVEEVGKVLQRPNVHEFLHIPVQSGSNGVLQRMVRDYTVEDFNWLVQTIRATVPNVMIATDIICGFPTESDEDHRETLELIKRHRFPVINISQYYARPGTPAAHMPQVRSQTKKERSGDVTRLFGSYCSERNLALVGTNVQAWFTETENVHQQTVGHTKEYIKVVVPRDDELLGHSAMVHITDATKWHVAGLIVEKECANTRPMEVTEEGRGGEEEVFVSSPPPSPSVAAESAEPPTSIRLNEDDEAERDQRCCSKDNTVCCCSIEEEKQADDETPRPEVVPEQSASCYPQLRVEFEGGEGSGYVEESGEETWNEAGHADSAEHRPPPTTQYHSAAVVVLPQAVKHQEQMPPMRFEVEVNDADYTDSHSPSIDIKQTLSLPPGTAGISGESPLSSSSLTNGLTPRSLLQETVNGCAPLVNVNNKSAPESPHGRSKRSKRRRGRARRGGRQR